MTDESTTEQPGQDTGDGEQRMLAGLARASLARVPELADALVDQTWGSVYTPDGPVAKDDLWRSCRDNIHGMLTTLSGTGPSRPDLLGPARSTGVRRAQQHCPLDWVLHAWRLSGQVLWADMAEHTGAHGPQHLRELVGSAGELWGVTERFSIEMALSYHAAEQELLGGAELRNTMIMDALLDGRATEVRGEAEHLLGLGRGKRFVVAVAETSGERPASPRELADGLRRRGLDSTWRLRTGCQVGIIGVGEGQPAEVAGALRERAVARIGVSQSLSALMEVGAGYRMAMLAMTTLPAHRPGAVSLDECLPDALALSSPELADRMVLVTFGPVLALPTAEREELLHTVSVWIRSLGSTLRAAKSLYCHRNTVLNRLRRMESLTHLDLSDVTVWPQILLALSILRRGGRLPAEPDTP
ncbi:CdaR family transcriptional regulator [Saccharopolyspora sp. 6M]|uniref:PucR family transcriptional regulator n=1 Tax=Saccharopolyspora sp. 6M TaxID=2877237 RepID=UPI001CD27753|nr:helix-turn-helix domain-containing protein [Saccharopolyspora sp. 6M]MCA1227204.1 helix-turn-helix domain-containing protein [Saccharopolyspora sp. 6M]